MEDEDILLKRFLFHYNFFNRNENVYSIEDDSLYKREIDFLN